MNAIYFGCKRSFHSCMRITREGFTSLGLTPARFDMMTAISRHKGGILQQGLRKMLGVTSATISRMLRSLELLGLVQRRRSVYDRRQNHCMLTEEGVRSLQRATAMVVTSGAVQLAIDCALTDNHADDPERCTAEMGIAESVLRRMRDTFRDHAELTYPWQRDRG